MWPLHTCVDQAGGDRNFLHSFAAHFSQHVDTSVGHMAISPARFQCTGGPQIVPQPS